jgi:hypothetical protein
MQAKDITGNIYGNLTAIARVGSNARGQAMWRCRCACGGESIVIALNLRSGNTTTCGCSHRRRGADHPNSTHLRKHTPEYRAWSNMLTRCTNPRNKSYANYGARGITVCDRWRHSFEAFLADVGERPDGTTLDRINNDGNYEPGNVRWASYFMQSRNRRSTKLTVDDANRIALDLRAGIPQRVLARRHGVSRGAIQGIWKRARGSDAAR